MFPKDGNRPLVSGTLSGRLLRRVDFVSAQFALFENNREFTLVPWRPVLEKQLGKTASGILRDGGVG